MCTALNNSLADRSDRFGIFGVGDMVRECSVRLKELTSSDICTQYFKYICRIETAYAVSGIYNDLKALQRMMIIVIRINLFFNHLTQRICITVHVIAVKSFSALAFRRCLTILCKFKDCFDIFAVESPFTGKEFQSVSVIGVMTCRDLNRTVSSRIHCCQEHGRCGSKVAVKYCNSCFYQCSCCIFQYFRTRYSRISADGYCQFICLCSLFGGKPENKTVNNCCNSFFCQVYLTACALHSDTSDIRAAFQLFPKIIQHN